MTCGRSAQFLQATEMIPRVIELESLVILDVDMLQLTSIEVISMMC